MRFADSIPSGKGYSLFAGEFLVGKKEVGHGIRPGTRIPGYSRARV